MKNTKNSQKDLWSVQILSENAVLSLTLNKRANFFSFRSLFSFRFVLFSIIYFIFYHRSLSSHWLWACGWIINTQKWIHISRQSRKRQSRVAVSQLCVMSERFHLLPPTAVRISYGIEKKLWNFELLRWAVSILCISNSLSISLGKKYHFLSFELDTYIHSARGDKNCSWVSSQASSKNWVSKLWNLHFISIIFFFSLLFPQSQRTNMSAWLKEVIIDVR